MAINSSYNSLLKKRTWITGRDNPLSKCFAELCVQNGCQKLISSGSSINKETCNEVYSNFKPELIIHLEPQNIINNSGMNIQSEIKDCIKSIINMIDMVNHTEDDITLCIPFQMNCIIKPDASTLYQHPIRYMIDLITSYVKNKKINKKLYPILHSIPLCNENLSNLEKYEQNFDEFVFSPINKLAFQISIILTSHPPKEIFLIEGGFKYGKSVSQKNKVEIEYTSKELSIYDVYKYFV